MDKPPEWLLAGRLAIHLSRVTAIDLGDEHHPVSVYYDTTDHDNNTICTVVVGDEAERIRAWLGRVRYDIEYA